MSGGEPFPDSDETRKKNASRSIGIKREEKKEKEWRGNRRERE